MGLGSSTSASISMCVTVNTPDSSNEVRPSSLLLLLRLKQIPKEERLTGKYKEHGEKNPPCAAFVHVTPAPSSQTSHARYANMKPSFRFILTADDLEVLWRLLTRCYFCLRVGKFCTFITFDVKVGRGSTSPLSSNVDRLLDPLRGFHRRLRLNYKGMVVGPVSGEMMRRGIGDAKPLDLGVWLEMAKAGVKAGEEAYGTLPRFYGEGTLG